MDQLALGMPDPEDDASRRDAEAAAANAAFEPGAYWDYCPNCGGRLHNQGCKYRCERCHYFMSCSDFD